MESGGQTPSDSERKAEVRRVLEDSRVLFELDVPTTSLLDPTLAARAEFRLGDGERKAGNP